MLNLTLVIVSILLTAGMLYAGFSYLNQDYNIVQVSSLLAYQGFNAYDSAWTSYKKAMGSPPSTATWAADLTPSYIFAPQAPSGFTWSYGTNGSGGYWFCLGNASANKTGYLALNRLTTLYSAQRYFVNNSCGATSNMAAPGSYPTAVRATYWMSTPVA